MTRGDVWECKWHCSVNYLWDFILRIDRAADALCGVALSVIRVLDHYRILLLGILGVCFYGLILDGFKLWLYPGWSWRGFLGDVKSLLGFVALLSPLLIYSWRLYRGKSPGESILGAFRRGLSSKATIWIGGAFGVSCIVMIILITIFGEASVSPELLARVDEGDWTYADQILARLQEKPLRPKVAETLETYVNTYEMSNREKLSESEPLRDLRNIAKSLYESGTDFQDLNTLSFAEASKAIYFVEQSPDVLNEGKARLRAQIEKEGPCPLRGVLLGELGELMLAEKDYAGAVPCFKEALVLDHNRTRQAKVTTDLANAIASEGDVPEAVALYRSVEQDYPEGKKFLFYSNLGYLLLLTKEYKAAEKAIKRALSIRNNDWISHLNLALVYDAVGRFEDARSEYALVAEKTDADVVKNEALILMGRSLELEGREFKLYVSYYLEADGRTPDNAEISKLRNDPSALAALYDDMAAGLTRTMTQGIERYIAWFKHRAAEVRPSKESH